MIQFTQMLSVVRHKSLSDLRQDWNALLADSAANAPFLDWDWIDLWWESFGGGADLYLLAVREGDALIGIAPFMLTDGRLTFACDGEVCDYQDIIARRDYEKAVLAAVAEHLAKAEWTELTLCCLAEHAVVIRHLPEVAGLLPGQAWTEDMDVCPGVDLVGTWEQFVSALPKKDRHELRRKTRRLEASGDVRFSCLVDDEVGDGEVDDFLALHRLSTPEKAAFMGERMEGFFRGIFSRFAPGGRLRLYFLEMEGRRVSTALCFDYGDTLMLYNSGYNPAYAHFSVGLLLKAFCVKDAINLGRGRFDFLRGAERYKYDMGARDVAIKRVRVVRRNGVAE